MKLVFILLTASFLEAQKMPTPRARTFDLGFFLMQYVHMQGLRNVHVLQDYDSKDDLTFLLLFVYVVNM